jgi:hypothetical protein
MPSVKPNFELDLKQLQNSPLSHPSPTISLVGAVTPRPATQSQSSTSALLSLSQDITALVSLSIEATASLVNDCVHAALGTIGAGELVRHHPVTRRGNIVDRGAGLAVVVVGAGNCKSTWPLMFPYQSETKRYGGYADNAQQRASRSLCGSQRRVTPYSRSYR